MEVHGKLMNEEATTVVYLSRLLNEEVVPSHKCDKICHIEHVWANIYRCNSTGSTHICDRNCNQRIIYDNRSCVCRLSGQVFPFTAAEEQAVRGVRRKLESDNSDIFAFKRRRDALMHPSPFERSFCVVAPICTQHGDSMDIN